MDPVQKSNSLVLNDSYEKNETKKQNPAVTSKRQSIKDYTSGGDLTGLNSHVRQKNLYTKNNADIETSQKADLFSDGNSVRDNPAGSSHHSPGLPKK